MTQFDATEANGHGLRYLSSRLDPILAERLAPYLHGHEWTVLLEELDAAVLRTFGRKRHTKLVEDAKTVAIQKIFWITAKCLLGQRIAVNIFDREFQNKSPLALPNR